MLYIFCLTCRKHAEASEFDSNAGGHATLLKLTEKQYKLLLDIEEIASTAVASLESTAALTIAGKKFVDALDIQEKKDRGVLMQTLGAYRVELQNRKPTDVEAACLLASALTKDINPMLEGGELYVSGGAAVRLLTDIYIKEKKPNLALVCRPISDLDLRIDEKYCGFTSFKSGPGINFMKRLPELQSTKKNNMRDFTVTTTGQTIGAHSGGGLEVSISVNLWSHGPLVELSVLNTTVFTLSIQDLLTDKLKTVLTRTQSMQDNVSALKVSKDLCDIVTLGRMLLGLPLAKINPKELVRMLHKFMTVKVNQYRQRNLEQSPVVAYLDDEDLALRMLDRLVHIASIHVRDPIDVDDKLVRKPTFIELVKNSKDYLEDMVALASLKLPSIEEKNVKGASNRYWSDVNKVLADRFQVVAKKNMLDPGNMDGPLALIRHFGGDFNVRLMARPNLNFDTLSLTDWFAYFDELGPPSPKLGLPSKLELVPLVQAEAFKWVVLANACFGKVKGVLDEAILKKGKKYAHLEKLNTAIKHRTSLERKLFSKIPTKAIVLDQLGRIIADQGELVHDVLRFTIVVSDDEPYERISNAIIAFIGEINDFRHEKTISLWDNTDISYCGLNAVFTFRKMLFEVQFHTRSSFLALEDTHAFYEEARDAETEEMRRKELTELMKQRWALVPKSFKK